MTNFEGGCLCGDVRYRIDADGPEDVVYCHCRMCQRASGAPAVAWATFRRRDFAFVRGRPTAYRSSPPAVRAFCGRCGSPLTFVRDDRPEDLDVTVASLDDPARTPPERHIWTSSGIAWFHVDDDLPRDPQETP